MKRVTVLTSAVFSLLHFHGVEASVSDGKLRQHDKKNHSQIQGQTRPTIVVSAGGWGNVESKQIELLLSAVASEILTHFPGKKLDPIIVSPSSHAPVVLYQKGPRNEYQILLAAKDQHWAEYIYEFSHELFHILAQYEYHAPPHHARHQWFEETLCETASLYMLKRFSLTWLQAPPLPGWRSYASEMQAFTRRALSDPHRQLPTNVTFDQWFRDNGPSLISKPYLREKNELVANILLPFLEKNSDWRAIAYLNVNGPKGNSSFYDHLVHWYGATPVAHRYFVSEAIHLFRFKSPVDHAYARAEAQVPLSSSGKLQSNEGPAGPTRH
ncbi:hypothetical protein [Noviherbaspirillum saxi]|uniref:hypothetical protein n=1 Tax=Noviherbaspirillum saxi TaxID=2320863 RepID=UPI0011C3A463|nr:hypothetical protein [Noviherbaspirillum saxi]